jgi:hypothetical protein
MGATLVESLWSVGSGHSQRRLKRAWAKSDRRWASGKRQLIEGVIDQLKDIFALEERHAKTLGVVLARLAAKNAAYICEEWINDRNGRPPVHPADLLV